MSDNQTSSLSYKDKVSQFGLVLNPDGTITRVDQVPVVPASADPSSPSPVLTKDLPLNTEHHTWVRLFLPRQAPDNSSTRKLPIIVYYHGGCFIICAADSNVFHDFCTEMAVRLGAVIVSVTYRLAPEHRLPAAYDDAVEALHWIKSSNDDWLHDFGDFSNCFLMGNSAGGNVVYHAGLRAAAAVDDLQPLKIKGLILHQPIFGGSERTGSELRLVNDRILPLFITDLVWELALPIGADRDHEYSNLTAVIGGVQACEQIKMLGWRVIVIGCDGDPLVDRQMELVKVLEKKGVQVVSKFSEGGCHGFDLEPSKAVELFSVVKDFMSPSVSA
ncbi:carboxylesterase 1-like [Cornus florida]|uniref:carboxylesterase 1-like n=1 Tax=Cornus florida TaxID=4283 RepID=UPI00289A5D58|nr:carboxylesterase 1-like [Cornus florida]